MRGTSRSASSCWRCRSRPRLVALAAHALTDLGWTQSFLLGALLSPTDPVLSSAIVNNPRVPRLIRHSLNLESGLNDGLALPAVLAFTAAAAGDEDFELVAVPASGRVRRRYRPGSSWPSSPRGSCRADARSAMRSDKHQKALYALGVAFTAYGIATLPPEGNGLIAVFVAAIGVRDLATRHRGMLQVAVRGRGRAREARDVPRLRGDRDARRPVRGRLGRRRHRRRSRCSWRGRSPCSSRLRAAGRSARSRRRSCRGSARRESPRWRSRCSCSARSAAEGERVFNIAALCVLVSIVAHGLTDHPGSHWIERQERKKEVTQGVISG